MKWLKEQMSLWLDIILCPFQWYRKWKGGKWYKYVRQNMVTGEDMWWWTPEDHLLIPPSELNYSQVEDWK